MKKQFVSFHSMLRGSGKTAAMVRVAKSLSDQGYKVLLVDGYIYEIGGLIHRITEILDSVPEFQDGNNLYDLIRDYELLQSVCTKGEKKGVEKIVKKMSRPEISMHHGSVMPEIASRLVSLPGCERICFLPGTDHRNMDIKPAIDFEHLFDKLQGCNFFDYFKECLMARYDFILIDAPVGYYTISGILCGQLADLFLAVDVDSPAYKGRPSYEVGLKLAEQKNREDHVPIAVKSVKGQDTDELVSLILENQPQEEAIQSVGSG